MSKAHSADERTQPGPEGGAPVSKLVAAGAPAAEGTAAAIAHPAGRGEQTTVAMGLVVLFATVVALYWPALSSGFVSLDDPQYVLDNPLVCRPGFESVRRFFAEVRSPSTVDGYYQPLTMTSLMADVWLSLRSDPDAVAGNTLRPFQFHLTNVLLHAGAVLLVAITLRIVAGGVAAPLLIAAVFAVHPVQVESVAWISQRKTVLAGFFALASVAAYLRHARRPSHGWLGLSVGAYALAALAKPTVVLLPFAFPMLDGWPLRRSVRRALPEKWPFAVAMAVTGWAAWVSQAASGAKLMIPRIWEADAALQWTALLCHNVALYLRSLLYPIDLSPFHPTPRHPTFAQPMALLGLVLILAAAAVIVAGVRRRPWAMAPSAGLGAFAVLLLPALGSVQFAQSIVSDRFLYVPVAFLLLPLAVAVRAGLRSSRHGVRTGTGVILLAAIIGLAARTVSQQGVWRNSRTLWTHVHDHWPEFHVANFQLATFALEDGDIATALRRAEDAVSASPTNSRYLLALGKAYLRAGRVQAAIAVLQDALLRGLGPYETEGWMRLAGAHIAAGEFDRAAAAAEQLEANGANAVSVWSSLGDLALHSYHQPGAAAEFHRRAVKRAPEIAALHWSLCLDLHALGRPAAALEECEEAVRLIEQRQEDVPPVLRERIEALRAEAESSDTPSER